MAMEIFKLMGTVAISKDKALKDIKAIQDQAQKASTAMGKSFTKFSGYVEQHSAQIKKAGKYLTVFGGIATAAFALSVKSAANFETQLANVSTMLDESAMKILPEYRKGLQSLSVDFGESTETLSKGLYDILSASIPPAEAMGVLEVSAKAAAAGITDTGVAADAITTILNSYGMSADQAGMVSDKLFAIVKMGKTTFAELAPSIGKVAATASMAGLDFNDLGASIATLTRAGIRTEEAMTAINGVLVAFLKPTDEAIEVAAKFGLTLDTNTLKTEGLTGVMEKLKNATAEQLAAIFPNIRGLKGMAAALGDAEGYARDYALMLDSAGLTQEAFAKQSDTLNFKLDQLKEMFNVIKVTVGTALIPAVEDIAKKVMGVLKKVKEWTEANPKLTETIVKWAAGISALMLVLGPFLMVLPGLISSIGLIKGGVIALTGATKGLYAILGPTNALILLIAGNILIWKKNIELITKAIEHNRTIGELENKAIDAKGKALLKLQKAYNMTGKELAYWIREGKLAPSVLERMKEKWDEQTESTKEGTEATKENTEATKESTEAKKEQVEEMEKLLVGSDLLAAQIAVVNAEYEITNKTMQDTAQYYGKLYELYTETIKELEEELTSLRKGTASYKDKKLEILTYQKALKDLIESQKELNKVVNEELTGIDLVNAKLSLQSKQYQATGQDMNYFTERAALLKEKYELILTTLEDLEAQGKKNTAEWFNQSEAAADVEAEIVSLNTVYHTYVSEQWVNYLVSVAKHWSDLEIQMAGLGPALDELGIKWRDLEGEAVEAAETSGNAWSDFFTDLKNKYSDSIGIIQSGISSFVSAFQGAIETALYSLWTMAETNAEIQQQMAETEQEYIDAKLEMNEEYKQSLITKLSEYVDAKELANMSIAELETLLKEHSITAYAEMSEANQTKLDELATKYEEILGNMEEEQVTFGSIMSNLWKTLVDAIIKELIRIAAQYIVMWLIGIFLGEGGGIGYKLGGEIEKYDLGGRIKKMQQAQARMEYFQRGGPKGTDVVPIWATPGEYIISEPMTSFIRKTGAITGDLIKSIQSGSRTPAPAFAAGGVVGAGAVGSVELNIMSGAIMINAKSLDDRTIAQAGTKLFAEIEKQARNAGKVIAGR